MKRGRKILSVLLLICLLCTIVPFSALVAFAEELSEPKKADAMQFINADSELSAYKQGETQTIADDGYIGIPVEITVYYDYTGFGAAKPGYNGTLVILYFVNSGAQRVGTDSDTDIIKSMLNRGYAVAVADYKNHEKAISPDLEYSVQLIRAKLAAGDFFLNKTVFPRGTYYENHAVPAGHDVSLSNVYFEIDKHGQDGGLEKIVETWNLDVRALKGENVIKWIDADGNRKATQNAFDGTAPVWYADANGKTVDAANGTYIKLKHTWAQKIEDCVKRDGSPIDLNLYMHIIYPTNPEKDVPVMALASSSEHLASGTATTDRPYLVGFAASGYAIAVYDFEYIPMARSDHYGAFSGDQVGGVTNQNGSFGLGQYNRGLYNTAAIRYLRYLSITDHDTFSFDNEKFGVYGNSKGGSQTFLGDSELRESVTVYDVGENASRAELEAYLNHKISNIYRDSTLVAIPGDCQVTEKDGVADYYLTFSGGTRYESGKTEDLAAGDCVIDGGELQPWLTYTDENGVLREIKSGVQWVYSSCGGTTYDLNDSDHSPVFTAANYYDSFGSGYTTHNYIENLLRIYDIPSLFFEAPLKHALVSGKDMDHGVDTYTAFFKSAGYFLKDDPVSVVYTTPVHGDAGIKTTDDITIRFYGQVSADEIEKVIIKDSKGNAAEGAWVSGYGRTQWTFKANALNGGEIYTVTVPKEMMGENGKAMTEDYSFTFCTEAELTADFDMQNAATVTETDGTFFSFTVPSRGDGYNRMKLRFKVANNAANTMDIYSASSMTDTAGAFLGSVQLKGDGYYELDVSDHVAGKNEGETVYFYAKAQKKVEDIPVIFEDFNGSLGGFTAGNTIKDSYEFVSNVEDGDGVNAVKITFKPTSDGYYGIKIYPGRLQVHLQSSRVINGGKPITQADYGRTFTLKFRVYNTASEKLQLAFNDCNNSKITTADYSYTRAIVETVAGQWVDAEVSYTVYEMDYGIESQVKTVKLIKRPSGSSEMPLYIDNFTVTEHVTAIDVTEASLVMAVEGTKEYKKPENTETPFEVGGVKYATWWDAVSASTENTAIKLLSDYNMSAASDGQPISAKKAINIDLNGYRIILASQPLFNPVANTPDTVSINISNGTIVVKGAPIIEHGSATAAGEGKHYDIKLTDVDIINADNSTTPVIFSVTDSAASAQITRSVVFDNCNLDVRRSELPKTPCEILPVGKVNMQTTYKFIGGSIKLSTLTKITLSGNISKIEFNAETDVTAFIFPNSINFDKENTYLTDRGYARLIPDTVGADNYTVYKLATTVNSTDYGIIPEEYDAETYPFAVFMNGQLIGVYDTLGNDASEAKGTALYAVWEKMAGAMVNKEMQIVLRRDYDMSANPNESVYHNLGQIGGRLVFDLGDHTLALKKGTPLLHTFGKYGSDLETNVIHVYDSHIDVLGGKLILNENAIWAASMVSKNSTAVSRYDKEKIFDISFDGTEFVLNSTGMGIVGTGSGTANLEKGARFDIDFNDCVIDIRECAEEVTLFKGSDSAGMNDLNVSINGGSILADSMDKVTLSDFDIYGDKLCFCKNSSGDYPTLTVPSDYALPKISGINQSGALVAFGGEGVTNQGNTVYEMEEIKVVDTPYGVIPEEYDAERYPFAVFQDGQFIGAYNTLCGKGHATGTVFVDIWNIMRGAMTDKEVQIVLRRDYDVASNSNEITFDNLAQIGGRLVFDLGDHTLTLKKGVPLFNMFGKYGADLETNAVHVFDSRIDIFGGKIVLNENVAWVASMVCKTTTQINRYTKEKYFDVSFNGTEFIANSNAKGLIGTGTGNVNLEKGARFDIDFNNCVIDLRGTADAITLFTGADSAGMNDLNVGLNGGSILANTMDNIAFSDFDAAGDALCFNKSDVGEYPTITVPNGYTLPEIGGVTSSGIAVFFGGSGAVNGEYTTYGMQSVETFETPYGTVPGEYDAETYPFALFSEGRFLGAYTTLCGKGHVAGTVFVDIWNMMRGEMAGKEVQVVLRRDYDVASNANEIAFDNLGQIGGRIVFDLGNYTLSLKPGVPLFNAFGKPGAELATNTVHVFDSRIDVFGGRIVLNENVAWVASMASKNETQLKRYDKEKYFDISFTGTEFIANSNAKGIIGTGTGNVNLEKGARFDVEFNDCIIDLRGCSKAITLFKGNDSAGMNDLNVVLNGGSILANSMDGVTVTDFDALGDTFKLGKSSDGSYTEISVTAGRMPAVAFVTEDGERYYGRYLTEENKIIYRIGEMTEYGVIPYDYPASEYPFAVFRDGELLGAYKAWCQSNAESALWMARLQMTGSGHSDVTVQILMRSDYSTDARKDDEYSNLAHFGGTLVIDLGGYTFTADGRPMFVAKAQTTGKDLAVLSKMIVKNGRIVSSGSSVIVASTLIVSTRVEYYTETKIFDISFTDVDLAVTAGKPIVNVTTCNHEYGGLFDITFNDCNIDVSESTEAFSIFSCTSADDLDGANIVNIKINGGALFAKDMAIVTIFNGDKTDSLLFGRGADETMMTLMLPIGMSATNAEFDTVDGKMQFTANDTEGVFELAPACTHLFYDECDTDCDICGIVRVAPHDYAELSSDPDSKYIAYICESCGHSFVADEYDVAVIDRTIIVGGYIYVCDENGVANPLSKNWYEDENGDWYYTTTVGALNINKAVKIGDCYYYFGADGRMQKELFEGNRYYGEDGKSIMDDVCYDVKIRDEEGNVIDVKIGYFNARGNLTRPTDDIIHGIKYMFDDKNFIIGVAPDHDHNYDNDCDTDCNECGEIREASHSFTDKVIAPNCKDKGYTLHTCSVCGAVTKDTYVDTNDDHAYDDIADAECNRCGAIREVEKYLGFGTCGVATYWKLTEDGVFTIYGEGSTYYYTASGMPWKNYRKQITKIVIEEGIVSLGACVFYDCANVAEIVLPEGLLAIGQYAFYGCAKVTTLDIPASVYYIGNYALRKVGATGKVAFNFADPNGWYRNGEAMGADFMSDVAAVTDDFRRISYEANWNKVTAEPVVLMQGYCDASETLAWTLDSNGTLTVSGEGKMPLYLTKGAPWFNFNGAIVGVVIEEGVTRVGKCSFYGAENVLTISLPESLETIGTYAFYYCRNVKEVSIPANVTSIGQFAFRQCKALTSLDLAIKYGWSAGSTPLTSTELTGDSAIQYFTKNYYSVDWTRDVNAEDDSDPNRVAAGICGNGVKWQLNIDGTLYIKGAGAMNNYNSAGDNLPWLKYADQITKVVVEEGVTSIGDYAFYNVFTKIESVTLPESLTTIGKYAFYGASGVKSVTIPANVSSIETMAFRKMGASGKLSVTFAVTEGWTCGGNAVDASFFADAIATGNALRGADYTGVWTR